MSATLDDVRADLESLTDELRDMLQTLAGLRKRLGYAAGATLAIAAAEDASVLRGRRLALRLSQQQVAVCANISRGLLADLESGRRTTPQTVRHVLDALERLERRAV